MIFSPEFLIQITVNGLGIMMQVTLILMMIMYETACHGAMMLVTLMMIMIMHD